MTSYYYYYFDNSMGRPHEYYILEENYQYKIWYPGITRIFPKKINNYCSLVKLFLRWILYYLFSFNRKYYIFLIYHDEELVHYSFVLPRTSRVPFMGKNDVEIGPVWTSDSERRKGLLSFAIQKIINADQNTDKFWWICRKDNEASNKAIIKMGFIKFGEGEKRKRFFLNQLGRYIVRKVN